MKKKSGFRVFFISLSITFSVVLIFFILVLIFSNFIGPITKAIPGLFPSYTNTVQNILPTPTPKIITIFTPSPRTRSTLIPTQTKFFPTPTRYIEQGWSQKDLAMNGFLVEIPDGWIIQEQILTTDDFCGWGKGLANYIITDDSGYYQELRLNFICGPRSWETSYCPPETEILDESLGIARSKMKPNEFQYWHFYMDNGTMHCIDGWKVADQVVLMAYYKSRSEIVLDIADFIVLSIRQK
jgi:hypothetical protein